MDFVKKLAEIQPKSREIALFFIAQAGFCIKTSSGKLIYIDPYLSDACERLFGFKRMIPAVITPEQVDADLYLITHHHADHLDPDTIPIVARNAKTVFVSAPDGESFLKEQKIPATRRHILKEGDRMDWENVSIKAIYADHGDLAPDAIGYLIEVDGIKVYHAGDTAYRPDQIVASLATTVDILIAPINGQYNNMTAVEACRLAAAVNPSIVIPSHFWMFLEHVSENGHGDPATFLRESANSLKHIQAKVMAPGEHLIYSGKHPAVS